MLLTHTDKGAPYKVAVYGTLKNGFSNHPFIRNDPESRFLGNGQCNGILIDRGAYPGAVLYKDIAVVHCAKVFATDMWIRCEVYSVGEKCLDQLDLLEGHPNHYQRQLIRFSKGAFDGDAWIYTLSPAYLSGTKDIIRSGEWFGRNTTTTKVDFSDGKIKPRIISVGSVAINSELSAVGNLWAPRTNDRPWANDEWDPIATVEDEEETDPEPVSYWASIAKKVKNA